MTSQPSVDPAVDPAGHGFDPSLERDPSCPNCGGQTFWEECDACGGDGGFDERDDDPIWYDGATLEEGWAKCDQCEGSGGWDLCLNSREWCESHPIVSNEGAQV